MEADCGTLLRQDDGLRRHDAGSYSGRHERDDRRRVFHAHRRFRQRLGGEELPGDLGERHTRLRRQRIVAPHEKDVLVAIELRRHERAVRRRQRREREIELAAFEPVDELRGRAVVQGGLDVVALAGETVFSIDGMGFYFINKLGQLDVYAVMAYLAVTAVIIIGFNLLADVLHGYLDPRIRYD